MFKPYDMSPFVQSRAGRLHAEVWGFSEVSALKVHKKWGGADPKPEIPSSHSMIFQGFGGALRRIIFLRQREESKEKTRENLPRQRGPQPPPNPIPPPIAMPELELVPEHVLNSWKILAKPRRRRSQPSGNGTRTVAEVWVPNWNEGRGGHDRGDIMEDIGGTMGGGDDIQMK
ncbi:hypothetical protein V8G54_036532 [Vigna mungo]|uniref:Uncharacterized protein n=1 Tax=Vigna mungo TaxID=3915 RepID=A0AAQ3RFJ2_VIGMU